MFVSVLLILLACLILFAGAELLVRGGASLALKLGLTPLVVGLTVVAFGTSMPELIVSLKAAMLGQSDIAVGNVVGSNIFNIAVILGLAAVVYPVSTHLQVLRWDAPLLVGVTLLVPLTFLDGSVSRFEGIVLALATVAYTWWAVRMAKKDEKLGHEAHIDIPEIKERGSIFTDVLKIVAGLGVLVFGSQLLVVHAVKIAEALGVSEAVIGLTIIAAGTSMPELATSVVAAFRKQSDIALGNVLGSNLFNILFVLGGSAAVHPVRTSGLQTVDLWMMIGITVVLLPMLFTGRRLSRGEGLVLVACYGGYLTYMWPK
ncbi:MAG: sodium:calcium antiporter [Verrucomicrobia bacterium]|nr:MAG: sodium:calcium antiporter [Verrucomicrobiota bacterium]TAE88724.1 MAG: sodium:calcium antiporter [Verrucomicrobiota bacterium]TAF26526.1 MAG: sodium:calcium antiporter [Verrucomicrobiota bacterium]